MILRYKILFFICSVLFGSCTEEKKQTQTQVQDTVRTDNISKQDQTDEKVILFFGNSLTAGYGLDPSESFPAIIQNKLDSLGYDYKVINAGLSGETTAGGKSRIDWVLKRQEVDIFVLELGANDGLRGVAISQIKKNLESIIETVRNTYPDVEIVLAGMMVPPNLGKEYSGNFAGIYSEIAKEQDVVLIPFLLENVAGETELNQGDGIHPTEAGQKIVAENVWKVLRPIIESEE